MKVIIKSSYDTLIQLILENRSLKGNKKFIHFYLAVGMLTTLVEKKLDELPYSDLLKVREPANTDGGGTMGNLKEDISTKNIADAITTVEVISKSYK